MSKWRFYQGVRAEWRWYHLDQAGEVIGESDRAFAELSGAMANAEASGFDGDAYQVHARQSGAFIDDVTLEQYLVDAVPAAPAACEQPSS